MSNVSEFLFDDFEEGHGGHPAIYCIIFHWRVRILNLPQDAFASQVQAVRSEEKIYSLKIIMYACIRLHWTQACPLNRLVK